jgi:diacylglycerol kinase (ATP)
VFLLKALFLINERSGSKRGGDMTAVIRESCTWSGYEMQPCGRKEDLDALIAGARRAGFEAIIAVGGDGTVHEVGSRLIGLPLSLGIIPTGSGNGFARHLRLPLDPAAAVRACGAARVLAIDTATVNRIPFISVLGVGFDAVIAERFAASQRRGLRTYVQEGFRAFATFRPEEYEIEIDGRAIRARAFLVAVANSSQYGNNAKIAPQASLQDGLLDVVIIGAMPILRTSLILARLFAGTIHRGAGVLSERGRSIVIRRANAGPAHLDGEPVALPQELRIEVKPESLNVLVPKGVEQV